MRKKCFLILGLLAIIIAGCSKNNDDTAPDHGEDAWKYDESLPVPIIFGKMDFGTQTRAAIETLDSVKGRPFGVFAWATKSGDKMSVTAASIFEDCYKNAQVFGETGNYSLKFVKSDGTVAPAFYPTVSKYDYSFHAYYLGENKNVRGTFEADGNTYFTTLTFDKPFNDILWGRFGDDDLPYDDVTLPHLKYDDTEIKGFNARFSRAAVKQKVVAESAYYPDIEFHHSCSSVRFYAKADTSMTEEQLAKLREHLSIDSLSISNVPYEANLIIASKTTSREGTLEKGDSMCTVMLKVPQIKPSKEGSGTSISDGKEDRFFIVPGVYNSTVTVYMTLLEKDTTITFPLEYQTQSGGKSSQFNAGECSSFVVIFKSIEEIMLKARLENWEDGAKTDIIVFDDPV